MGCLKRHHHHNRLGLLYPDIVYGVATTKQTPGVAPVSWHDVVCRMSHVLFVRGTQKYGTTVACPVALQYKD